MVDEPFIRKVKYGLIVFILAILQLYVLSQSDPGMDPISLSLYQFIVLILWIALAYFGIRLLILLTMNKSRIVGSIDELLCRMTDAFNNGVRDANINRGRDAASRNRSGNTRTINHYHYHERDEYDDDSDDYTDDYGDVGSRRNDRYYPPPPRRESVDRTEDIYDKMDRMDRSLNSNISDFERRRRR